VPKDFSILPSWLQLLVYAILAGFFLEFGQSMSKEFNIEAVLVLRHSPKPSSKTSVLEDGTG
jgi:hypothetical protein